MMISSLGSPFICPRSFFFYVVLNDFDRSNLPQSGSTDERAAEVQLAFPDLAVVERAVPLAPARPDQVHDLVAARHEELRDKAPVAAVPRRLGAHQARRG